MALIKCSECGKKISDKAEVCIHCGCPLIATLPESPELTNLTQSPPRVTEQDFINFIGINANEYLPKFKKFISGGSSVTWHWPACLLTVWWMLYRKLYLWALGFSILYIVSGLFSNVLLLSGGLLSNILFGLFANYIYYNHTNKKILELKSKVTFADSYGLSSALRKAGGVNRWVRVVVIIMAVLALVGIFLAILIPQFANYEKCSSNLQERSESHEKPLARAPSPTEQEQSKYRMKMHEENYKKILKDNPDRDPYVLEQGMEAIRNDPISPYNYATVDDLEKFGRERIRKAAQKSSGYGSSGESVGPKSHFSI